MNKTRVIAALMLIAVSVLAVPAYAQPGNVGHNPEYPALPQKEVTPDYLLVV